MNIDSVKIELIDWITKLNDKKAINKILKVKQMLSLKKNKSETRIFGSGKHLVEFISDDFNEPLNVFNDYQK